MWRYRLIPVALVTAGLLFAGCRSKITEPNDDDDDDFEEPEFSVALTQGPAGAAYEILAGDIIRPVVDRA